MLLWLMPRFGGNSTFRCRLCDFKMFYCSAVFTAWFSRIYKIRRKKKRCWETKQKKCSNIFCFIFFFSDKKSTSINVKRCVTGEIYLSSWNYPIKIGLYQTYISLLPFMVFYRCRAIIWKITKQKSTLLIFRIRTKILTKSSLFPKVFPSSLVISAFDHFDGTSGWAKDTRIKREWKRKQLKIFYRITIVWLLSS